MLLNKFAVRKALHFGGQEMSLGAAQGPWCMCQVLCRRPVKHIVLYLQDYQRLLSSQPARRLNPAKLAESSVLKNKLVDTIAFLENLAVKDSAEKDLFFKRLPGAIPGLPLPVLRRKLLPMLAQALTFGGAPAVALGSILQVRTVMQETPCIEGSVLHRLGGLALTRHKFCLCEHQAQMQLLLAGMPSCPVHSRNNYTCLHLHLGMTESK